MNITEEKRAFYIGQTNAIYCLNTSPSSPFPSTQTSLLFSPEVGVLGQERVFAVDVVLGPDSSQEDVFAECDMTRLIDIAIKGYSCTVFAFGQTGSGKTYTITGPHSLFQEGFDHASLAGLMQRSLLYLLEQVNCSGEEFHLCVSYLEIYNEQVRDLLNPWLPYTLVVRGSKMQGFYVENLSMVEFQNLEGFMKLLERGMQSRQSSPHSQNEHSSRSHSILTVYIKVTREFDLPPFPCSLPPSLSPGVSTIGKLCVVDLAGSERVRDGDSTEELLEETGNINRSLLTLGKCISSLVDPKKRDGHIPYRDSKLTKLLSDSLGGSGITLMIACVSPTLRNLQETLNTLHYSSRARRIRNKPMVKRSVEESGGRAAKDPGTLSCPQKSGEERRAWPSSSETSLRSMLQELRRQNDKLQRDKLALLDSQESFNQQRAQLSQENDRLLRKLEDLERVISSSPHSDSSHSGQSVRGSCGGGYHNPVPYPCKHTNGLVMLPPLQDGPPQRAVQSPVESTQPGPHHLGPAPADPAPHGKKCQAGYADRYQELKEARTQKAQRTIGGADLRNLRPVNHPTRGQRDS
ncbi:kinesin-like protein KIF12 [Hypomesus transpacificus]|uniref:kinesin-like protein KIF12 n=1 Tax=Hypomesus transpacificus TaxID=137520 RepID=UPI001F07B7C4|nr:kinesin-like protein KIF12 [Hypomesus transpacificus]